MHACWLRMATMAPVAGSTARRSLHADPAAVCHLTSPATGAIALAHADNFDGHSSCIPS